MASLYRVGKRWRAQVSVKGERVSAMFDTKQQASAWALEREASGKAGNIVQGKTLGDALDRFAKKVAPKREGGLWEVKRCTAIARMKVSKIRLAELSRFDLAAFRDARLDSVAPGTVLREFGMLRTVLKMARKDWGWLSHDPMEDLDLPKEPPSRKRRITQSEIERVTWAAGMDQGLSASTLSDRTFLAWLFALETAMRSGEIVGLSWTDVDLDTRVAHLPKTKNGDARDVPMTSRAVEILRMLPRIDSKCFAITDMQRDALWRKIKRKSAVDNLTFHDSRSEAIWRLSKKLDVLQLARAIGHRDLKSLLIYYNESAEDMAKRLS